MTQFMLCLLVLTVLPSLATAQGRSDSFRAMLAHVSVSFQGTADEAVGYRIWQAAGGRCGHFSPACGQE